MPINKNKHKFRIKCGRHKEMLFIIPTIIYIPKKYRYQGMGSWEIHWLHGWIHAEEDVPWP